MDKCTSLYVWSGGERFNGYAVGIHDTRKEKLSYMSVFENPDYWLRMRGDTVKLRAR